MALVPVFLVPAPGGIAVLRVGLDFDVQAAMKTAELPLATRYRVVQRLRSLGLVVQGIATDSAAEDIAYVDHAEYARIPAIAVGADHTLLGRTLAAAAAVAVEDTG